MVWCSCFRLDAAAVGARSTVMQREQREMERMGERGKEEEVSKCQVEELFRLPTGVRLFQGSIIFVRA